MTMSAKSISSKQRTLSVGLRDEATFENYFPHQNAELLAELKRTSSGEGEHVIYFYGTGGLGRTHLSQACCHYANQFNLPAIYLPFANLSSYSSDVLQGLESLSLVCVDDLHMIAGLRPWEEAFLYFYNRLIEAGGRLIITAKTAPKLLGLILADVASRLSLSVVYQLHPLTDEEKLDTLIKRAQLRGLILSAEVASFILTHSPRHMSTLFAALDTLDKESLSSKRRPTIPFVKEVLEI